MSVERPVSDERVFDVIYESRAIRRFTDRPVPDDLLVQLVDAAVHAPSAGNAQNWSFVIVRDEEQKRRLQHVWRRAWTFSHRSAATAPLPPGQDPAARQRALRRQQYLADHLQDVPALIFVGVISDGATQRRLPGPRTLLTSLGVAGTLRFIRAGPTNTGMVTGSTAYPAVQNLLLAARAVGLGAVMTTQHFYVPGEFEKILGCPKGFSLAAIVPVGWPATALGPTRRADPQPVISWDRWTSPTDHTQ
jgi:nitroreductase